jgi:hypothetical protein
MASTRIGWLISFHPDALGNSKTGANHGDMAT